MIFQGGKNMSTAAIQVESMQNATTVQEAPNGKPSKVSGRTVGEPQLSEEAAKYYEELKRKYGNMEFVLVSSDMKELAKAQAGSYANPNRMVVLIDEEKIEKMAADENYRKQYEGIISSSASKLQVMKSQITSPNVKGYGILFNDGGNASFFAVIDKSLAAQRERIADKREKAAADKKADAKKDAKKAAEERRDQKLKEKKRAEEEVTVTAPTLEDLLQKIDDINYAGMSDQIWSEQERMLGQSIDFRG